MAPFKSSPTLNSRNLDRNAFALRLDTSVDVSVVLQDMRPGSGSGSVTTLDLKEIFSKTPLAAPGKFYNPEAGSKLLSTLKTGGPCARVELMPGEDEEHEQNWEKFRDRLENKDTVSPELLYRWHGSDRNGLVRYWSRGSYPCPCCLQQRRNMRDLGCPRDLDGIKEGDHRFSHRC